MDIGERIRYLRKDLLNMSQDQFGECLGIKKSSVSQIESGKNALTSQNEKSICREFGVREEWLRSGEGEPFGAQTRNQEIQAFINDVMAEEDESRRKRFIYALSRLDLSGWEALEKVALAFLNDHEHEKED